jgi:hypothetical protein
LDDKIKEDERCAACSTHEGHEKCIKILIIKPEERRPLGIHRLLWEDNVKKDLRERRWKGVDWIHLAWDRDRWRAIVKMVMKLRAP